MSALPDAPNIPTPTPGTFQPKTKNTVLHFQFQMLLSSLGQTADLLEKGEPVEILERMESLHRQVLNSQTLAEVKVTEVLTPKLKLEGRMAGICLRFSALMKLVLFARYSCRGESAPLDFVNSLAPIQREIEVMIADLRTTIDDYAQAQSTQSPQLPGETDEARTGAPQKETGK